MTTPKPIVIFFGNGPLADATKSILIESANIIFHARSKADLDAVRTLKLAHPEAHGILASFGVLIKSDLLDIFEPEGILNLHPSLLPDLRGSSPIESAILRGDTSFGLSIMKLVSGMDAGPVFFQTSLDFDHSTPKSVIYQELAQTGAKWLVEHLSNDARASKMPAGRAQDDSKATFCGKLKTTKSELQPALKPALELHNEVRAFYSFPKSRFTLFGLDCIIHQTHVSPDASLNTIVIAPDNIRFPDVKPKSLALLCQDGKYLYLDALQPAGKRAMNIAAFINGYAKKTTS